MLTISLMLNTLKRSSLMNDIQMKDAKNMDGMIVPSSRCTMHRMASSRDYSSSSSSGGLD
jgi:hypothetical protein